VLRYSDLPPALAAAFQERATISGPELCKLLPMDPETLRRHCKAGNISYVQLGFGDRRAFTLEAVLKFLGERSRTECPSTGAARRRSSATTSTAAEYDFRAIRARRIAERQKQRSGAGVSEATSKPSTKRGAR
jgi:hypothetical protein